MSKLKMLFSSLFSSLAQNTKKSASKVVDTSPEFKRYCELAAIEGIVLLMNKGNTLPLDKHDNIAVFGRGQIDYSYVGNGSGGDIIPPYLVSPIDAFINHKVNFDKQIYSLYLKHIKKHPFVKGFWGMWPYTQKELKLNEEIVKEAALKNDTAVVIISRNSGEDLDQAKVEGSWYLSRIEKHNLELISQHFNKTVVIVNSPGLIDFSYLKEAKIDALLLAYQGGQESGNGLYNVLFGKCSPSGKLVDTIAKIESYPKSCTSLNRRITNYNESIYVGYRYFLTFKKEDIIYPFGYGLTYSSFDIGQVNVKVDENKASVSFTLLNNGQYVSKEVVQLYVKKKIDNNESPSLELMGFIKSEILNINERSNLDITFNLSDLAIFNENNKTYEIAKGKYELYLGFDSLNNKAIGEFEIKNTQIIYDYQNLLSLKKDMFVMRNNDGLINKLIKANKFKEDYKISNLPLYSHDKEYTFNDLLNDKCTVEQFISALTFDDLEHLTRGSDEGMFSSLGTKGNAAVIGGTNKHLISLGVPSISLNDGPSGVRNEYTSTLIPSGTMLASTFNTDLVNKIASCLGKELKEVGSSYLLAPGMNVHRHPLGGRNFEYFSEDPILTAKMAISYVAGIESNNGVKAVIKHFLANNKETGRHINDSRIDQKALFEIYLKPFEMVIKNTNPGGIMFSYNRINGEYGYYNYELGQIILKGLWSYQGLTMTDWWIQRKNFKDLPTQAQRIRCGVDLFMPGTFKFGKGKNGSDGTLEKSLKKENGLKIEELYKSAANVIRNIKDIVKN